MEDAENTILPQIRILKAMFKNVSVEDVDEEYINVEEIDESNITENVSEMSENVTEITEKNQVLCVTDKLSNLNFEVEKSRTPDETVSESFAGTFSMKKTNSKKILQKNWTSRALCQMRKWVTR